MKAYILRKDKERGFALRISNKNFPKNKREFALRIKKKTYLTRGKLSTSSTKVRCVPWFTKLRSSEIDMFIFEVLFDCSPPSLSMPAPSTANIASKTSGHDLPQRCASLPKTPETHMWTLEYE
jgi:hypothetical protein